MAREGSSSSLAGYTDLVEAISSRLSSFKPKCLEACKGGKLSGLGGFESCESLCEQFFKEAETVVLGKMKTLSATYEGCLLQCHFSSVDRVTEDSTVPDLKAQLSLYNECASKCYDQHMKFLNQSAVEATKQSDE